MPGYTEKEIIQIVLIGSMITLLLAAFLVSFVYFYQRRHFAFLKEKQEIQSQFQEELLKTKLEIQEETFKAISEEIHDNIGQTLSFIKLNLNTIDPAMSERERGKWEESKELLTKVIQELRSLSRTLSTDDIQRTGLVVAVKRQLQLLERSGVYQVEMQVEGEQHELTVSQQLLLYRVIQELLNNIVKHADAGVVRVILNYQADGLSLVVSDDGKGFDPGTLPDTSPGLGLRNIRNRIAMIQGSVSIRSGSTGTFVTIVVPNSNEGKL